MRTVGSKTKIDVWFNNAGRLKNKRSVTEQQVRGNLETITTALVTRKSYTNIVSLIEVIENLPDVKIYRKDFLYDIAKTLRDSERLGISATKSIERNRNILRQKGRKIQWKGIVQLCLLKGLNLIRLLFSTHIGLQTEDTYMSPLRAVVNNWLSYQIITF